MTRQRLALPARAAPPQPVEGGAGRDGTISIAGDMLAFAGLLGLLGLVGVRFAVVDAAVRSAPRPPGHGDDERWRAAAEAALGGSRASWRTAVWVAGGLAGAGLLMSGGGIVRELGEGLGGTGPLLGETRWGRAWLVQAAGLCVALAAAGLRRRSAAGRVAELGGARAALIGGPAAAALVAISWSGHATSGTDAVLGGALDALHLLASALWIGGLIALIVSVPTARRRLAPQDATRLTAGIVVRFSALAIACVGVIVVTGVYRGLAELRSLGDLLDTGYGQALLVKLGLFAVLMTGGAYNRLVLHPRLERAALGLAEGDRGAGSRLASSVRAELILATGVIAAAAVLVALPPP